VACGRRTTLLFQSFGFRDGIRSTRLMFDARMLPNPHYDPLLRPLTGMDAPVIDFMTHRTRAAFRRRVARFLERWLPEMERENRNYVTVAIGCTVDSIAPSMSSSGSPRLSGRRDACSSGIAESGSTPTAPEPPDPSTRADPWTRPRRTAVSAQYRAVPGRTIAAAHFRAALHEMAKNCLKDGRRSASA